MSLVAPPAISIGDIWRNVGKTSLLILSRSQNQILIEKNSFLRIYIIYLPHNLFIGTSPVEVETAEEGREWLASQEVFHGLRDLGEELFAAGAESFLALRDQGIVQNVDYLRTLPLQVLLEQFFRQIDAILVQLNLVFLDRVQKEIVAVIGWFFILAELSKEQPPNWLLVHHITVPDVYPTITLIIFPKWTIHHAHQYKFFK